MALFDEPIKLADLPEDTGGDFKPIPDGWYSATLTSAEVKPTKDGSGKYIACCFDVTGPEHQGRKVWTNLNINNRSEVAEGIGRQQLRSIMEAGGLSTLRDTDEMIGTDIDIKVTTRKSEQYGDKNEIKAYRKRAGAVSAKPAASKSDKPWG